MKKTAYEVCVSELKECAKVAARGSYAFAKRLAEAEISGIWKTKIVNGKPAFRNFDEFAAHELGMTGRYVRQQLQIFNQFTQAEFESLPSTKLLQVLRVPATDRERLLGLVKKGASRREIVEARGMKYRNGEPRRAVTIVRGFERGGPVRLDMLTEENRLARVEPLSDLLVLAKLAERIYQDKMRASSSRRTKGAA